MSINIFSLKDYSAKRALELAGGTGKGTYILVQITSFGHRVYAGWSDKNVFSRVKSSAATLFKKKQFMPDFAISYNMGRSFGNNVVDNTALVEKHLISLLTQAENNHLQVLNVNQRQSCNVGHLDETTLFVESNRAKDVAARMISLIRNHEDEIVSAAKPCAAGKTSRKSPAKTIKELISARIKQLLINSSSQEEPLTAVKAMRIIESEFGELGIETQAFRIRMNKIKNEILEKNPDIVFNLAKQGRQAGSPRPKKVSKHDAVIKAIEVLVLKTQTSSSPVLQEEIFEQLKKQGIGTDLTIYNFRRLFILARKNVLAKNPDVKLNLFKQGQYAAMQNKRVNASSVVKSDTSAQEQLAPVVPVATTTPNYRPRFNFDYNIAPVGNEFFFTFMPIVKDQKM